MNKDSDKKGKIIVMPQFDELKREVEKLRVELSMLVLEKDTLIFVECKNIEMAYMVNLGHLEVKAFELECKYLRLRRKIELIQAKLNRQEKVDLKNIEDTLEREFIEYEEKLKVQMGKLEDAIEWNSLGVMSEEKQKEIKKLYRAIAKKLPPDLNPNITKENLHLFNKAVKAYENGDLETLKLIEIVISDKDISISDLGSMAELEKEKTRLKSTLEKVTKSIEAIKREYPYNLKSIIDDEVELSNRKKKLDEIIIVFRKAIANYETQIQNMLR